MPTLDIENIQHLIEVEKDMPVDKIRQLDNRLLAVTACWVPHDIWKEVIDRLKNNPLDKEVELKEVK